MNIEQEVPFDTRPEFQLRTVIQRDAQFYMVSTVSLKYDFMYSYETMVFLCDEKGEVRHFREEAGDRYFSQEEAIAGHHAMVVLFTPESSETE